MHIQSVQKYYSTAHGGQFKLKKKSFPSCVYCPRRACFTARGGRTNFSPERRQRKGWVHPLSSHQDSPCSEFHICLPHMLLPRGWGWGWEARCLGGEGAPKHPMIVYKLAASIPTETQACSKPALVSVSTAQAAHTKCWYVVLPGAHSLLLFFFNTRSHIIQADLQLLVLKRMTLNFWSTCLHFQHTVMTGVHHLDSVGVRLILY